MSVRTTSLPGEMLGLLVQQDQVLFLEMSILFPQLAETGALSPMNALSIRKSLTGTSNSKFLKTSRSTEYSKKQQPIFDISNR